ncbi:hypothetical protein AMR72_16300 [Flavobacterium psychrophilum]|nr:hypothetical protein AMR72_16300 [Flavobacterium psychrophilum]AOE53926.1 hypothetical protein ALW18_16290 [Flavobacterium psychrophilum]
MSGSIGTSVDWIVGKPNEITVLRQSFIYSGSQNFILDALPSNILSVSVNGVTLNSVLPAPVQFKIIDQTLIILDLLEDGDVIWVLYTNSVVDKSSYSKSETDNLISNIPIAKSTKLVNAIFSSREVESTYVPVFPDAVGPESGSNYGMGFPIGAYQQLKKIKLRIYINVVQSPLATQILARIKKVDKNGVVMATATSNLPATPVTGNYTLEFDFGVIGNTENARLYLELFSLGKFGVYRKFPNAPSIFTNANGYPPYALSNVSTALASKVLNNTTVYYDFYHEALTVTDEFELTTKGEALIVSKELSGSLLPTNNLRISFAGSSVTWGDGYLQSHYVGSVIKKMQTRLASAVTADFISTGTLVQNRQYFDGKAKKISGAGSELEFTISGNEVSIVQGIDRSNAAASEIDVYVDNVLHDTFNNYNPEPIGNTTKTFIGNGVSLLFDLGRAFTYNHVVTINGIAQDVIMNLNQSTGFTLPAGIECAVIRRLGIRNDGTKGVTHWLYFAVPPVNSGTIECTYNYGESLFYEKTTIGQDNFGINESPYGDGDVTYDTQNPAAISTGLDLRQTDARVVKTYRFTENKERKIRLRIKGNYGSASGSPYFIFNFATNRYFHFQNAGIGGWDLWDFDKQLSDEYMRGWQRVVAFNPDIMLYETTPNDDVRVNGHKLFSQRNLSLAEARSVRTLPLREVTFQSTDNIYSVSRWNGVITEITETSVTFSGTLSSPIAIGDIILIGNYYANNTECLTRMVAGVTGNTITFSKPISPEEHIYPNLQSLIGNELRIRDFSIFKAKLQGLIAKVRESLPNVQLGVIPNPLPNIQTRELWGYPLLLSKMADEHNFKVVNCKYFQKWQDSQMKTSVVIPASSLATDPVTGFKVVEFGTTGLTTISPDIIVNGQSVYGKDAIIENGFAFGLSKTFGGAALNKPASGTVYAGQERNQKPRLLFKQNAPTSGNITIKYATNVWSPDSTHLTNAFGVELYAELLFNEFILNNG